MYLIIFPIAYFSTLVEMMDSEAARTLVFLPPNAALEVSFLCRMDELLVVRLGGKLYVRLAEMFTLSLGLMLSERLGEKLDERFPESWLRVMVRGYLRDWLGGWWRNLKCLMRG